MYISYLVLTVFGDCLLAVSLLLNQILLQCGLEKLLLLKKCLFYLLSARKKFPLACSLLKSSFYLVFSLHCNFCMSNVGGSCCHGNHVTGFCGVCANKVIKRLFSVSEKRKERDAERQRKRLGVYKEPFNWRVSERERRECG